MILILSIFKEFSFSELFDLIICLIKLSLLNLFWNLGFFFKELSYFTFQYFQSFFPLFFKLCLLLFFFFPSLIHFEQNLLFYLQFYHFNLLLLRILKIVLWGDWIKKIIIFSCKYIALFNIQLVLKCIWRNIYSLLIFFSLLFKLVKYFRLILFLLDSFLNFFHFLVINIFEFFIFLFDVINHC